MSDRDIRSRLRTSHHQEQRTKTAGASSRAKNTVAVNEQANTGRSSALRKSSKDLLNQKDTARNQASSRGANNSIIQKTKNTWPRHRLKIIPVIAITLVVGSLLLYWANNSNDTEVIEPQSLGLTDEGTTQLREAESVQQVSFNPFFPSDFEERGIEFVLQRQGDTEYAQYADRLEGVYFVVAQQRVPEEFVSGGSAQIESLARALPVPAERPIQVDNTRFFISEPSAARQTVVFEKENVLVIVSADEHISEAAWAGYITNLKQ